MACIQEGGVLIKKENGKVGRRARNKSVVCFTHSKIIGQHINWNNKPLSITVMLTIWKINYPVKQNKCQQWLYRILHYGCLERLQSRDCKTGQLIHECNLFFYDTVIIVILVYIAQFWADFHSHLLLFKKIFDIIITCWLPATA